MMVLFIGMSIGPLLLVGAILAQRSFAAENKDALELQRQVAQRVSTEVESFLQGIQANLSLLGDEILRLEEPDRAQQIARILEVLNTGPYRDVYDEITLLDDQGQEQIRISRLDIAAVDELRDRSTADEFREPSTSRETYFGPVWFDEATGEALITVAVPVNELRSVQLSGVLVANLRFDTVGELIAQLDVGEGQNVYVVDQGARVVATGDSAVVPKAVSVALPARDGRAAGLSSSDVLFARDIILMGNQEFSIVAERASSEALATAYGTIYATAGVMAVALVVAVLLVILAVRQVVGPIQHLASVAKAIESGDLDQRVRMRKRRNEIGQLANSFNRMAEQLSGLIGTLEARVQARTRDLQVAAEVSERVATILDPEQLLPQVVELTKDSFDLYHAHMYLYDTASSYLVLAAGAGEAGRIMKEGGHRILGSARSLVAQAARQNHAVIVDDVRTDPNFLPNPLLPDTHSEAAIPLAVGERVIGVLDVQSDQVARFDRDLISVLSTLSSQIAVSLDNARLFSEMERTTRQERVLGVITQEMQRATSIDDVLQVATRELGKALRVSETAIELYLPDDGHREAEPEE
jgi:putative methionine-R-sulfoxide reductase with GAF domain